MKAAVVEEFGPPESLVIRDLPEPEATPGTVVVEVRAAGVNFPDVLVVSGEYQILPERPFAPGKEVAGVVKAVGAGVNRLRVGQRVMAQIEHGGYAERLAIPEELVVALPDGLSFEEGAAFGLGYVTAYFGLTRRGNLTPGETVLVTGAGGGVGSAGVQLAKALGATVIAVAEDAERAALATEQGADHVLDADPATLREQVRAVTDGRGVDVALELVGGDLLSQVVRSMAWEGRLIIIGFASGKVPQVHAGHILVKNISVSGLQVSDYRDREPQVFREALEELLELQQSGSLRVPVVGQFSLDEAGLALSQVGAGQVKGKVVLCP